MTTANVDAWLARAVADANARGLPELQPLLQALARSTQALRDADEEFGHPAARHEARRVNAAAAEADDTPTAASGPDDEHGAR